MYQKLDKHFGIDRAVRNLYETVYEKIACRIGGTDSTESLDLILPEDICAAKYDIFGTINMPENPTLIKQETTNYTCGSEECAEDHVPISMIKFKVIKTGEVKSAHSYRKDETKIYIKFVEDGKEYGYLKDSIEFL